MIAFILMAIMAEQGLPCPVRQSGRAHRRLPSGQPQQRAGAGFCCSEEGRHRVQDRESAPPQDVRLLIEISDSTLAFDLGTRANLYARAEIADYWVVDIAGRRSLVRRAPNGGSCSSVTAYTEGAALAPLAAPHAILQLAAVLPPR